MNRWALVPEPASPPETTTFSSETVPEPICRLDPITAFWVTAPDLVAPVLQTIRLSEGMPAIPTQQELIIPLWEPGPEC